MGGSHHPDPGIGGGVGGGLEKKFFSAFGPQFGLKIREGSSPGSPIDLCQYTDTL